MTKLTIIDLANAGHEVPVAIRHPDGHVLVLTLRAHRRTLTVIGPKPVALKVLEDSGEVAVSWMVGGICVRFLQPPPEARP